ncbi:TPPP family protein CG45057 [Tetranychus urticae]|uniref:TPPP family protein CG45057 n=1 Tax=Tetranychus urticae TaxID=32264 RepID=UPI00077B99D6|nr:TPPP family protein CG45057 [Tetranychus urticae]
MTDADSRPISVSSEAQLSPSPNPPTSPTNLDNNNNVTSTSPSPDNPFESNFRSFAKFGDSKSTGEAITLSNSDKWFKQAKVIDGKKITTVDTGIYFKKIAKTKKALNLKEYVKFLEEIAKNKKIDVSEIKQKLSSSGPPATTKTTTAACSAAVARLTDHTKYTGTHKQRFDETGKGRGKIGRVDPPKDTGYVQGFQEAVVEQSAH